MKGHTQRTEKDTPLSTRVSFKQAHTDTGETYCTLAFEDNGTPMRALQAKQEEEIITF